MTTAVVVVGAGGFGRETLDVVAAVNASHASAAFTLVGVVDDAPRETFLERLDARGVPYLGSIASWLASDPTSAYLIGVGSPAIRRRIDRRLGAAGLRATIAIHPSAVIGSEFFAGAGTVVCAGAQVSTNVRLGRHVHLNPNVTIGHDSILEDFVSINPSATVSGDCRLGAETYVGSSSVILQGLSTGPGATIGAAACVVRDVDSGVTVIGVPAEPMRPIEAQRTGRAVR